MVYRAHETATACPVSVAGAGLAAGEQVPHPESFVAEATFKTMLRNANVRDVRLGCRLLSASAPRRALPVVGVIDMENREGEVYTPQSAAEQMEKESSKYLL